MKKIWLYLIGLVLVAAAAGYGYLEFLGYRHDSQVVELEQQSQQAAQRMSAKVKQWQQTLTSIAADPELPALMSPNAWTKRQAWLTTQAEQDKDILRLRALRPGHSKTDEKLEPHMGFAGLELIRLAEAGEVEARPEVHKMGNAQRHVAIAVRITNRGRLRGVLLASFNVNALKRSFLTGVRVDAGWLSLQQKNLQVAGAGDGQARTQAQAGVVPVSGTPWTVVYRQSPLKLPLSAIDLALFAGVLIALLVVLGGLHSVITGQKQKRSKAGLKTLLKKKVLAEEPDAELSFADQLVADAETVRDGIEDKVENPEYVPNPIFLGQDAIALDEDMSLYASIFRAYDIRGVVGETLTDEVVEKIGQAVGTQAQSEGQTSVAIARDGRHSSPGFSRALAAGLQATGCNVIDVGQVPTPVLYFATHVLDTQTGVMITGSHNPSNYNGLKIVINGHTLSGDAIQNLYERVKSNDFVQGEGEYEERLLLPEYIGAISSDVQMGRMMKVVVDCGNGVAGEAAPMLLSTLGCEVVPLYCEIDGDFPNHHPDPSKPENLQALIAKVDEVEAELGLAFDGDGDRVGVVDCEGNIIWPDRQMMLYAADVLSRQAGADIIFDVKCSRHLAKQIVKHGGKPVMAQTGHSLIKAKMKETGAELAGEMSGHIFFKERWYGFDDGLYTAARLLEIISAEFRSTAEIFAELPDALSTPELNISLEEGENFEFIEALKAQASFDDANVVTIDGLRVEYKNGWGLVRASNTTPSLVIRFEADTNAALQRIQEEFRAAMLQVRPDLTLPF